MQYNIIKCGWFNLAIYVAAFENAGITVGRLDVFQKTRSNPISALDDIETTSISVFDISDSLLTVRYRHRRIQKDSSKGISDLSRDHSRSHQTHSLSPSYSFKMFVVVGITVTTIVEPGPERGFCEIEPFKIYTFNCGGLICGATTILKGITVVRRKMARLHS